MQNFNELRISIIKRLVEDRMGTFCNSNFDSDEWKIWNELNEKGTTELMFTRYDMTAVFICIEDIRAEDAADVFCSILDDLGIKWSIDYGLFIRGRPWVDSLDSLVPGYKVKANRKVSDADFSTLRQWHEKVYPPPKLKATDVWRNELVRAADKSILQALGAIP